MASGAKMSYNHFQSGKFGGLPQQQTSQKEVEVTQDMHLKMSKKIAQLTKVIYALNTKNDENDQVLQTLREQHEEEIQQILADTRQKVALYKDRLDDASDQNATIEALQARIAEHQSQQSSVEEQFAQFKSNIREKQEREREEYSTKLFEMSHDALKAKKDFEDHLEKFNNWRERIQAEHTTSFAELESKHQKEMGDLRSFQRNQDDTWLNQVAKIEDKFRSEIEDLKSKLETMEIDKVRLNEEYTAKLEKAQAFYENELEALKRNQTQEHDAEVEAMRKELDRLKGDFGANDKELRIQIDRLVRQLADTEDALEAAKKEQQILQAELSGRDSSSSELAKQLQDLQEQFTIQATKLQNTETELAGSKQHVSDLADELGKKSTLLGKLEATNMQKDSVISSLQEEIDKIKQQLAKVEAERSSLLSHQKESSSEQQSQLHSLRLALEDMTVQKETQKQKFEKQIKSLQEEMERKEKSLKEELEQRIHDMEKSHVEVRDNDRKTAAEVLIKAKQEMKESHDTELRQAKAEYESLSQEFEKVRSDLTQRLETAEANVKRLEQIVKESEAGLGSASGQLKSLREAADQLRAELEKTRSELKLSKSTAASLQSELDRLKILHESKVTELETIMKKKVEQITLDLDTKWKETMKSEGAKLRQELSSQMENEKRAALAQLSQLKDQEIAAVRVGLDNQIEHLKKQIEELQSALDKTKCAGEEQKTEWEFRLQREQSRLNKEMLEAANDYALKIAAMEKMHAEEVERLEKRKNQEMMEKENSLQAKHLEELQGQMAAHKAALDHASQLEQRERQQAIDQLKEQQAQEKERQRDLLKQQHELDIEILKKNHSGEIMAARMELDRAVEISRQKEKDHQMQLEELRTELGHREQHIKNLQDQLLKLQEEINKLKKQIEAKATEIKNVQKQATQQLRIQEDKLTRQQQQALANQNIDHQREQQELLAQFTSAQEMLKDKISTLQIELLEAQERYDARDSRPEDLEMIDSLRCDVNERELRIKDLIDEKKFYQLELVNRETNFNKVFNTAPNVGVLNPFQKPKKKGDKVPNLSMGKGAGFQSKLDPLPNSPLHDGKLNPQKPLPQPNFTKKFVK